MRGALEISHQLGHFINNTNKLSLGRNGLDDAAAINELFCDYNTQVKKGQVCARIDPRPYGTVVNQAKANLAIGKAQLLKDLKALGRFYRPTNISNRLRSLGCASTGSSIWGRGRGIGTAAAVRRGRGRGRGTDTSLAASLGRLSKDESEEVA